MKLELNCVVSLHTKSEEKLPLDNISLFLLFEIARSYDLFNMTALSGENPKRRNTDHRSTEGPTHRRVKTPKSHDTSYPSLRRNIILQCSRIMSYWSYRSDTSYNTDTYCLDMIYSHYNDTPSWHHIPSCWCHVMLIYCVVSYHMIRIFQLLIQYHTHISTPRQ